MRILVIQQKRIGDVLIGTTLCNNLRRLLPDAEIHYLIFSFTRGVVAGNPNIDEIVEFEDADRTPLNLLRFARRIRRRRYDVVIDPYSKLDSWIITLLSGATTRISYKRRLGLYNVTVAEDAGASADYGTALSGRLDLLRPIVGDDAAFDQQHRIYLSNDRLAKGRTLLNAAGVDPGRPVVVFGIYGSTPEKTWPERYLRELLAWFQSSYEHQIVFDFYAHQSEEAERFCASVENRRNVFAGIGGCSLRMLAAVMQHADLYIGNDSGRTHVAKSMRVPTFTIFAPFVSRRHWGVLDDLDIHDSADIRELVPGAVDNLSPKSIRADLGRYYSLMAAEDVIARVDAWISNLNVANRSRATIAAPAD